VERFGRCCGRLLGLRAWTRVRRDEEEGMRLAAELVAQDVERPHAVAEVAGDLFGGVYEVGPESLVPALLGIMGFEQEATVIANVFWCALNHIFTLSSQASCVEFFHGLQPAVPIGQRQSWTIVVFAGRGPAVRGPYQEIDSGVKCTFSAHHYAKQRR